jgi:uncharacterized protein GlcG (DUF336 family)
MKNLIISIACCIGLIGAASAGAAGLPSREEVRAALKKIVAEKNGGLGFNMWATIVDRDGVVQVVAFSGDDRGDQWPGSRVISAQKANTANAFSLPKLALATANLYSAVQPGGSLYGLQASNPVDTSVAYGGNSSDIGTDKDPMVGKKIGGVNIFGGGLALYDAKGTIVGGIGVSGDTACADHNIAWKLRHALALDTIPGGISPTKDDNIIYDVKDGKSAGGFGHPVCSDDSTKIAADLPKTNPIARAK